MKISLNNNEEGEMLCKKYLDLDLARYLKENTTLST